MQKALGQSQKLRKFPSNLLLKIHFLDLFYLFIYVCVCVSVCIYVCMGVQTYMCMENRKRHQIPLSWSNRYTCESWLVIWFLAFKFQSLWSCNPLSHLSMPSMKSPSKAFQTSSFNCFSSLLIGLHNQGSYLWIINCLHHTNGGPEICFLTSYGSVLWV